jgi:hypothetical protein
MKWCYWLFFVALRCCIEWYIIIFFWLSFSFQWVHYILKFSLIICELVITDSMICNPKSLYLLKLMSRRHIREYFFLHLALFFIYWQFIITLNFVINLSKGWYGKTCVLISLRLIVSLYLRVINNTMVIFI